MTCVLKHPTQINLKYKGFQQFAPIYFFEFVHIFGSVFGPLCDVTSRQVDLFEFVHIFGSVFGPLCDVTSRHE